ncbi:MAG: UDP-N-acetylglucosamine 1-carboxyvinyltransferase [Candidatus Xenobia bacterium]
MERLVIQGGVPLHGRLAAPGSKNASLPIMAACLLAHGDCVLDGVPDIADTRVMAQILGALGAQVERLQPGVMRINTDHLNTTTASYDLVRMMNASFDVAGPLLARYHAMEVALPGGCNLGTRPVNLHIDGFRQFGAQVTTEHGYVQARTPGLRGAHIHLPKVSVGATKNLMMAATLAEGTSTIENAAREPEIIDLASFLIAMGARISGAGTSRISIEGVRELHGVPYRVRRDRIAVGTWLLAGAVTQGDLRVEGLPPEDLTFFLSELEACGQEVSTGADWIQVRGRRPVRPREIETAPFPGFPTDLHPPMVTLLTLAEGTSIVQETIFDGRFMYVNELTRLGADVRVTEHTALIRGVKRMAGAPVEAPDIRAGGALVLAGLAADGETSVGGVEFIDRGYEQIELTLQQAGARIRRIKT